MGLATSCEMELGRNRSMNNWKKSNYSYLLKERVKKREMERDGEDKMRKRKRGREGRGEILGVLITIRPQHVLYNCIYFLSGHKQLIIKFSEIE